jgi:hypothetical protein
MISSLDELVIGMNDLSDEIKTTIKELKYLETFAKELDMARAADIVNKQIKKIEQLNETDSRFSKKQF